MLQAVNVCDIHFFGPKRDQPAWKKALGRSKQLFFHPSIPYTLMHEIFLRSRVVFCSIPFIKHGFHERLFLALACGASVLTNKNAFLSELSADTKACLPILFPHYEDANALIQNAFSNEKARLESVMNCHSILAEKHTWDVRVHELAKKLPALLDQVRAKWQTGISHLFLS
jgi:hypothetical protein